MFWEEDEDLEMVSGRMVVVWERVIKKKVPLPSSLDLREGNDFLSLVNQNIAYILDIITLLS